MAWSHYLLESKLGSANQVGDDDAAAPAVSWPMSWGTAGQPAGESPYCHVLHEQLPHYAAAQPQTKNTLRSPPPQDFLETVFNPQGSDFRTGFEAFEQHQEFTVWRVPVPDFNENEDTEDAEIVHIIPFQPVSKDYLLVSQVMLLRALKDYLVCWSHTSPECCLMQFHK